MIKKDVFIKRMRDGTSAILMNLRDSEKRLVEQDKRVQNRCDGLLEKVLDAQIRGYSDVEKVLRLELDVMRKVSGFYNESVLCVQQVISKLNTISDTDVIYYVILREYIKKVDGLMLSIQETLISSGRGDSFLNSLR